MPSILEKSRSDSRVNSTRLKSLREDHERSFRSISSTVSSPGCTIREEIDPSTYSFSTALKALQAKTVFSWDYVSSEGLTLNSKWNDAEKYICNPLSGEIPLECLSAKTLSGRSFRSLTTRVTMSAPLVYPSQFQPKSAIVDLNLSIQEKKKGTNTRDVGIQSTPADLTSESSCTPSPAPPTPSIEERSIKRSEEETGDSSVSSEKLQKPEREVEVRERKEERESKKVMIMCRCSRKGRGRGCLSLKGLWQRKKCKSSEDNTNPTSFNYHINACYNQ